MEHEKSVAALARRCGVDDRVTVHAAHSGRHVVVGVDGGDLRDPREVGQVEVEQGVLEVVARVATGNVAAVAGCGCQVRAQYQASAGVSVLQLVEQSFLNRQFPFGEHVADVGHEAEGLVDAVARREIGGCGG